MAGAPSLGGDMATYSFETITAAQALVAGSGDVITVGVGSATDATVIFGATGGIDVTFGSRTVSFAGAIGGGAGASGFRFSDGSLLYIGDGTANNLNQAGDTHSAALFGGAGDDSLVGNGDHNLIQGNAGNDRLSAFAGTSTIYGGQGDDTIAVSGSTANNFLQGNKGDDQIGGSRNTDTILGGQGNDNVSGGGGSFDYVDGNLGNDTVTLGGDHGLGLGEDGADRLFSLGGANTLDGGEGNDTLSPGGNADVVHGGNGADSITLSSSNNTIFGEGGSDYIRIDNGASNYTDAGDGDDNIFSFSFFYETILGGGRQRHDLCRPRRTEGRRPGPRRRLSGARRRKQHGYGRRRQRLRHR